MFRHDENISHPGEGRVVCYDSSESHLPITVVHAKRHRVFDRALDHLARPTLAPIRMIADEVVNKVYVEAGSVGTDGVFTTLPKLRRIWCGINFRGPHGERLIFLPLKPIV